MGSIIIEEILEKIGIDKRRRKFLLIAVDFVFWVAWFYFIITYLYYWNILYAQPLIEAGEKCTVYCSEQDKGSFDYLENSSFNIIWKDNKSKHIYSNGSEN